MDGEGGPDSTEQSLRVNGLTWQGPHEPGDDRCSVVSFIAQQTEEDHLSDQTRGKFLNIESKAKK